MRDISRTRGWGLPVAVGIPLAATFILALVRRQVDLGTYLMGGAHALGASLYQVVYPPTGLGFTYPPFAALLFVPLAHLPMRVDQVAISWVNVGLLFGLLAVSLRAACPTWERRAVVWWALVLVLPAGFLDPIRETMLLGQVNLLVALLVIADMTLDLPLPRGVLVGLAAALKVTPVILIPYLFLTRQARAGWRATGVFAAAAAVAAAASPHASWRYWSRDLWYRAHTGNVAWIGNQGIVGVIAWLALGADRPPYGHWWAVGVAIVFWAAPLWWVHHGSKLRYVGRGWLIPVSDSFFLALAIFVVATAIAIIRRFVGAPGADADDPAPPRTDAPDQPNHLALDDDRPVGAEPASRIGSSAH